MEYLGNYFILLLILNLLIFEYILSFSMDGDIAPLDKIVDLANKYNAIVFLDLTLIFI